MGASVQRFGARRHGRTLNGAGVVVVCVMTTAAVCAPVARADYGWVAVAKSPARESLDWNINTSREAAETAALRQCAVLQNARDCALLASGPNCVAVAWDAAQPLNRAYAAAADTPAAALNAAVAAAGPFANDPDVRCSYFSSGVPGDDPRITPPGEKVV